ncbi:MAG: transglycosylase domain-containing protein [Chitinophagales bacterium]|nr:transglycosylase domain-containing protein [Bacteroidota bacterium]MBP8753186.1 transglycosylase domain-containing protein [Chitinophagales bacterium]MBP9188178.1 transglycosylase domain-containing protein [Chitinophagales bacterium]MBP9549285.1 transglycosylase domain-containing protein [Chitinophagales bacterium]MBP9704404.1 transglycosylase domain-containing protein [Chitinophagales bacterium]
MLNNLFQKFYNRYVYPIASAYPIPVKVASYGLYIIGSFAIALFLFYLLILGGVFGFMPGKAELRDIKNYTASEVYSSDSVLIGKYFIENRTNATYAQLPPQLIEALVATEDARFYEHGGIDFLSFMRVMIYSILLNNESSGGGSTISQQLAKNLFQRKDIFLIGMPVNKMREMMIAGMLERIYTKEEILTLYFNTVPFGENCFGIEAGALRFFNKKPHELSVEESAVLVGLLKANTTYNPRLYPERSLSRRNTVLALMQVNGYLTKAISDSLQNLPLELDYNNDTGAQGSASYFREYLRIYMESWSKDHLLPDGTIINIYTDGLKIYTTIDSRLQKYAEEAMQEHMEYLQTQFISHWANRNPWGKAERVVTDAIKRSDRYKHMKNAGYSEKYILDFFNEEQVKTTLFSWGGDIDTTISPIDSVKYSLKLLRAGFLAMDPSNGNVKAWVGGIDFGTYKYDHVKSKRQVGSTFKPIVYAAALEAGINPCTMIPNLLRTYPEYDNWQPENSGGEYGGAYSMKGGLTYSVNTIAVQLAMEAGISNIVSLAKKMGITSSIPSVPAIALGTTDISLFEMIQVYSTIDNRGTWTEPVFISRIESSVGDTIFIQEKPVRKQAFSQANSALLIDMMRNVINQGTGARLRGTYGLGSIPLAGKTGTTQNNTDGWFIGFTPKLVAGIWVGGEDPSVRFRSTALGQGASMALPVFGKFMNKVVKDPDTKKYAWGSFNALPDSMMVQYDCPLWIPDTISVDSLNFFKRVFHNIRNKINADTIDSIEVFDFPGAE